MHFLQSYKQHNKKGYTRQKSTAIFSSNWVHDHKEKCLALNPCMDTLFLEFVCFLNAFGTWPTSPYEGISFKILTSSESFHTSEQLTTIDLWTPNLILIIVIIVKFEVICHDDQVLPQLFGLWLITSMNRKVTQTCTQASGSLLCSISFDVAGFWLQLLEKKM